MQDAGLYNTPIAFFSEKQSTDDLGSPYVETIPLFNRWGRVFYQSGREMLKNGVEVARAGIAVRTYFDEETKEIEPDTVLEADGKKWQVISCNPDPDKIFIDFVCVSPETVTRR